MFLSHHTRWLETEYQDLKRRHADELTELKNTHAESLSRVIQELNRVRAERDRLQLLRDSTSPRPESDAAAETPRDPLEGKQPAGFTGTPWMRILQREIALQDEEAKQKFTKPVEPAAEAEATISGS